MFHVFMLYEEDQTEILDLIFGRVVSKYYCGILYLDETVIRYLQVLTGCLTKVIPLCKVCIHNISVSINNELYEENIEFWLVCEFRLLLMVSGQRTFNILRRKLFINTCTFLMMVVVAFQVSAPYSRTVLTFVLKILTSMLTDSCLDSVCISVVGMLSLLW
ncbi:unnamed protein product [Schistosoma margrebowiei]|uniref:Uncharacterized protein n=1 Tax=Schistosoma margrebowiei TaxID=48269 RepID=A0A183LAQ9_9TREM|nr:unnamed protein product [Schistosoma margrebowiei]